MQYNNMLATENNYLIDSHCHIDFKEFDDDRDLVLDSALAAGVKKIIVPAVAQNAWQKTIDICNTYPQLLLALGLHPIFIELHQPQHLVELEDILDKALSKPASECINQKRPCAVGEIGLDFYLRELDRDKQTIFFTKQAIIAKRSALPIIIHNRNAHDECIRILQEIGTQGGIIHAFNGSIQQARKYIEMGFLLGFGGMLTFDRSRKLHALAKHIPLDSIALETDAPDMTVAQHKGERNSPEYLPYVQHAIAGLKDVSVEEVAHTTSANVRRIFNLSAN